MKELKAREAENGSIKGTNMTMEELGNKWCLSFVLL